MHPFYSGSHLKKRWVAVCHPSRYSLQRGFNPLCLLLSETQDGVKADISTCLVLSTLGLRWMMKTPNL